MKSVVTENLTKWYGRIRGITDINLEVEEKDFFGFIGPNGAGKSTTIRTLLGLLEASGGSARILGMDFKADRKKIAAQVGYLPSETMFYPGMRVKEILRYSARLRGVDCRQESMRLCERLRLETEKKVEALSLGNRKKVGIVCAMQHKPALYIMDEPTSGLDPLMQREFFALLQERNREGATVFLSSHVLSEIKRYCNRAAIIRDGRLIACDKVDALTQTGARRVNLWGSVDLKGLTGIRDLQQTTEGASFLYQGEMGELTAALARGDLTDVTIGEPDLEEIFLHYYTQGGEQE